MLFVVCVVFPLLGMLFMIPEHTTMSLRSTSAVTMDQSVVVRQSGLLGPVNLREHFPLEPWTFVNFSVILLVGGVLIMFCLYKIARMVWSYCWGAARLKVREAWLYLGTASGEEKSEVKTTSTPTHRSSLARVEEEPDTGTSRTSTSPVSSRATNLLGEGNREVRSPESPWWMPSPNGNTVRLVNPKSRTSQRGVPSRRRASLLEQMVDAATP